MFALNVIYILSIRKTVGITYDNQNDLKVGMMSFSQLVSGYNEY